MNKDTLELTLHLTPTQPWSEVLIAQLAELGFDGFIQTETGIQAYSNEKLDIEEVLAQTHVHNAEDVSYTWETRMIPHTNWNAQWEAGFEPVFVEEYATIAAPFHNVGVKGMCIRIQPQMSFGTGHHQTTWMMTKELFELPCIPDRVLDMGAGTGVLAIVAEKLGAKDILAVDIEPWSAENTAENAERNQCTKIRSICGDVDVIDGKKFGLILANINKNVLKLHMDAYVQALDQQGILVVSGFFGSDVPEMVTFCQQLGLTPERQLEREEWAALRFRKQTN